eukprot:COSAG02_NODE_3637_length_6445_cov_2.109045_1_plen_99_part_00
MAFPYDPAQHRQQLLLHREKEEEEEEEGQLRAREGGVLRLSIVAILCGLRIHTLLGGRSARLGYVGRIVAEGYTAGVEWSVLDCKRGVDAARRLKLHH